MTRSGAQRLLRNLTVLAALSGASAGALAGCAGDSEPTAAATTATSAPATASSTPSPTASTTPTRSPSTPPAASPTRTASPGQGGNGDAEGDDAPATAGGGVCGDLDDGEVGAVLGASVTGKGIQGGGCTFEQGGAAGMTVTVQDQSAAEAGGMDGAKATATSGVEGEPEDLGGVGTAAFVVTGTMFGGSDVQGAGAVQVQGRIVGVLLEQHRALSRARVRSLVIDLLELVVREKT